MPAAPTEASTEVSTSLHAEAGAALPPAVLIVGGGFCGVALACALFRGARRPLRVQLLERGAEPGRGLAYGSPDPQHLLNVPAGRMGLRPDDEAGFARYLQARGLPWRAADFVPRALYGDYLAHELAEAAAAAAPGVVLEALRGEALACLPDGVRLADGRRLQAQACVLATGGWPVGWPAALQAMADAAGWVANPWQPDALAALQAQDDVLLLGSGLTALDLLASLHARGHAGRITLLSRRGLLPQAHRGLGARPAPPPPSLRPSMPSSPDAHSDPLAPPARPPRVAALLRTLRQRVAAAAADGQDWREVLTALRDTTPALWQTLPRQERSRFLRHLLPFWDTHRHRAAPPVRAVADAALHSGRLQLLAGRVLAAQALPGGGGILHLRRRTDGGLQTLQARWVVNCTGAGTPPAAAASLLWRSLLDSGQARVDPLGLGIEVDPAYRLLAAQGQAASEAACQTAGQAANEAATGWHYIGPLLRAQHWEATAVPELRRHAQQLATALLATLPGR